MFSCRVNLIGPFNFGQVLVIGGQLKDDNCNNFKISLCDKGDDIPLSIFVNFRTNEIVINSYINSAWISESLKISMASIPFSEVFSLYILASERQFHIAYNGSHVTSFGFQPNIENVRINGDVTRVNQVDHRTVFPIAWPLLQENLNQANVFSHDIPAEFRPGCTIVIKMIASGSSSGRFHIAFTDRGTRRQLFHFNPRFGDKSIVVNSQNDAWQWMTESKVHGMPMKLDKEFMIAIAMTSSCFKVAINGKHLVTFDYRMVQIPRSSFAGHNQIFERLVGMKMYAGDGLKTQVLEIDHVFLQDDCQSYEILSDLNFVRRI